MHLRTVFLLLILVFCGVFLVVNWPGITTDVPVDLLYTEVSAPLGLILLLSLGFVIVLCLVYAFLQQAGLAIELRRAHKELEEARTLAQRAERSRFIELQTEMKKQIEELKNQSATRHTNVMARFDAMENKVLEGSHETINSVSASVGEVEDRLSQLVKVATKQLEAKPQTAEEKK